MFSMKMSLSPMSEGIFHNDDIHIGLSENGIVLFYFRIWYNPKIIKKDQRQVVINEEVP